MTVENEALYNAAVLGEQVDSFMRSDVGQYIIGRANRDASGAMEALKKIDSNDESGIRHLQNIIYRSEGLLEWLEEAVTSGLKAKEILEERDE